MEFCRGIWSVALVWSLEWNFDMEFWCGVWSGVFLWSLEWSFAWSLEWSFGVESGVHFQSSVIEIYINNFSTCNFVYLHMDL